MNERIDPSGAGSEGQGPEDAGLSVEEKFARLAAEIDGSAVAGPGVKEEAARTRELRARWARNPPPPAPWRADGPKAAEPDPTPTPADLDRRSGPRKSARRRAVTSAKIVTALALVGLIGYGFRPHRHADAPLNLSPAGTAAPWTAAAAPDASASPTPTFTNPDDRYFVGSPALTWADNEAGFVVPTAESLNGVSRSDVAAGYRGLTELLAAGNLDATVLDGGSIGDFTNLLDPSSQLAKSIGAWIAHPSYQDDPTMLVTRFNPATTRPLGHTVKVDGSMSEKAGPQQGTVTLTADYIFVYAVGPAAADADADMRVSVHRTLQVEVVNPAEFNPLDGKVWISEYTASISNIQCYKYDGYVDPEFENNGAAPNKTGTIDPYATGNLLTAPAAPSATSTAPSCQAVTGD